MRSVRLNENIYVAGQKTKTLLHRAERTCRVIIIICGLPLQATCLHLKKKSTEPLFILKIWISAASTFTHFIVMF